MSLEDEDILERPVPIDEDQAERVRIRIRKRLPGRRLDKYLHGRFPRLSRTTIQRLIKQGAITVNGQPTKASYEMNDADVIELVIPPPEPREIVPEPIPLDIVYEDEHLLAINKQAGIICHPARGDQTGTLVNGLAYYAGSLSHGEDPFRPGIVHRLDKNTTGIMLVAKTDEAHWRLSLQFERRTVQKTYIALVHGEPQLDGDTIDAPIGVHPVVREKFAVMVRENKIDIAKSAVTHYEVAERFGDYALVKLFPRTGRTHQLRVHMSHTRHPIVGDLMYGGRALSEFDLSGDPAAPVEPLFAHQALHAWRIAFRHPILETRMELEAPFPPKFKRAVELLRARAGRNRLA
ncbi:MAG: RluA family pseudouridine synthase [Phycisphaerales bacterium]|nr:RluA family pseudouridine synthase [Phycisphaerales bacterium]